MPEPLLRFAPFQHSTHVYVVGELLGHVGSLLEADPALGDVWLRGEVSGVSRSAAGHHYFTLKDENAQLRCVLFRGNAFNSPVTPANGLALVAHGVLQLYARQGACELVADLLFPEGVGLAQMQSEHLYRRLEAEGLFDRARKRPLPAYPRAIGVVSSERGAVIHDLLNVLGRRYPLAEVVFAPAPVQGPGAAVAMAHAMTRLAQRRPAVDVLILARGGGSEDDLAAFNDERLARAVFGCPVPVISAVGHATNLSLTDLVADVHAPTPSAAAELVTPDLGSLRGGIVALRARAASLALAHVTGSRQRAASASQRLLTQTRTALRTRREQSQNSALRLRALSPYATLSRGYAIVEAEGHVLHDAGTVQPGAHLIVRLHRGRLTSTVDSVEPES